MARRHQGGRGEAVEITGQLRRVYARGGVAQHIGVIDAQNKETVRRLLTVDETGHGKGARTSS
ncbi:hypothetical protein AEAC466_19305 [Asticcacaulis sp. AC466]|nr:hypothetical protein AEAC466_19305 [Asticcacaulis sp. AC466]